MYIPKYFKVDNLDAIYDVIEQHSFATLFSQHNGQPYATHLPFTLNRQTGVLSGHVARPNKQWTDAEEVLVVFQGPHCYISPSWYETTKAVPTWNYVAVHVYGKLRVVTDEEAVRRSLDELVNQYELPNSTYNLADVDASFIDGLSKGIVAFDIEVTNIDAKAKLSQNHSAERQQLVIEQLEKTTDANNRSIAKFMRDNLNKTQQHDR